MSTTHIVGKVANTPVGEWNAASAYEKLDIVSSQGSSYMAKQDVPAGTLLTNTTYWLLLAEKGADGSGAVSSVNGQTGVVVLDATDIDYAAGTTIKAEIDTKQDALTNTDAEIQDAVSKKHEHLNAAILASIPTNGTTGYVLKKTNSGTTWAEQGAGIEIVNGEPHGGSNGDVIIDTAESTTYVQTIDNTPTSGHTSALVSSDGIYNAIQTVKGTLIPLNSSMSAIHTLTPSEAEYVRTALGLGNVATLTYEEII